MAEALENAVINTPIVPIIANVTANEVSNTEEVKSLLVQQVTGRVRWRESVKNTFNKGITEFVEIGSGKVLSGLNPRIEKEINSHFIGSVDNLKELS